MSLVSVLVSLGIASILALVVAQTTKNGLDGQKKIEESDELNSIRRMIGASIDCNGTFAKARALANVSSDKALCALPNPKILLYRATASGKLAPMTSDLDPTFDNSAGIGNWRLKVRCDWANQTLVVRAARMVTPGKFSKDPLTQAPLDFNNPKLVLFGGNQSPLCLTANSTNAALKLLGSQVGFVDTRDANGMLVEPPEGTKVIELAVDAQFQGKGDVGADVATNRIMIDLDKKTYSGTQMVKIGSDAGKSRSVYWQNASLGSAPILQGHINTAMSDTFRKEKMPNPLVKVVGTPDGNKPPNIRYTSTVESPGNNDKRWWAESVMVKYYGQ
jgi:hypothetical protein